MPDEKLITEIENILDAVIELGAERERTRMVPNLLVTNDSPGKSGFVIVRDDRDGDNILARKVPGIVYGTNDLVNVLFVRGGEAIAFQQGSESTSSNIWELVPATSTDIYYNKGDVGIGKSVAPDAGLESLSASQSQLRLTHTEDTDYVDFTVDASGDINIDPSGTGVGINGSPTQSLDVTGKILSDDSVNGNSFAFIAENTSGAAASANDVGYIDEAGEYKTTTTANDDVAWCVVLIGGANNADIHVTRRGRVTVAYTGTAPSTGDFLTTSTSAGDAQQQTTVRPEIFAVCTANGAGGTVEAQLLTQRKDIAFTSANDLLFIRFGDLSDFVSTIAVAGVSGQKVYYNAPTSGNVNAITPRNTTELAKLVLHNTTQTLEAFIEATGTDGTGNFIQVTVAADIAGWVATDAITVRSQTNVTTAAGVYFFDVEIQNELPSLTVKVMFTNQWRDTGSTGIAATAHPFETNANSKQYPVVNYLTAQTSPEDVEMPIIQNRFVQSWDASGSGTAFLLLRIRSLVVAEP